MPLPRAVSSIPPAVLFCPRGQPMHRAEAACGGSRHRSPRSSAPSQSCQKTLRPLRLKTLFFAPFASKLFISSLRLCVSARGKKTDAPFSRGRAANGGSRGRSPSLLIRCSSLMPLRETKNLRRSSRSSTLPALDKPLRPLRLKRSSLRLSASTLCASARDKKRLAPFSRGRH